MIGLNTEQNNKRRLDRGPSLSGSVSSVGGVRPARGSASVASLHWLFPEEVGTDHMSDHALRFSRDVSMERMYRLSFCRNCETLHPGVFFSFNDSLALRMHGYTSSNFANKVVYPLKRKTKKRRCS